MKPNILSEMSPESQVSIHLNEGSWAVATEWLVLCYPLIEQSIRKLVLYKETKTLLVWWASQYKRRQFKSNGESSI